MVDFNFLTTRLEKRTPLPPSAAEAINEDNFVFICYRFRLTSSSGTPNLRRSCLAFLRESRRRSASVPVTVFFTGWGSLSSCSEKDTACEQLHVKIFPRAIFRCFLQPILHFTPFLLHNFSLTASCSNPTSGMIPFAELVCLESSHKKILPHNQ